MDYESAVARLLHHASIGMTGNDDPATSFTYALWYHQTHAGSFDFRKLFREIIDCLEVVNRHVNGPTPSQTCTPRQGSIDVRTVHAVAAILNNGWNLIASPDSI